MNRWECAVCGHIHTGNAPPVSCPICGAPARRFVRLPERAETAAAASFVPVPAAEKKKVVIVGAGIAGCSAASALRELSPDCQIDLFNGEPDPPYTRMNLTRVLSGELSHQDLPLRPPSWFVQQNITLHGHCRVIDIDTKNKQLRDQTGSAFSYDDLILCSGASANIPELYSKETDNVLCLRSWEDLRRIQEQARSPREIICLGGGVLGVECASALAAQGHKVRLVHRGDQLLPNQLNRSAAEHLEAILREQRVSLYANAEPSEFKASPKIAMRLQDRRRIRADLLVLTSGVTPVLPICRPPIPSPCPVDTRMATAMNSLWAAGDNAVVAGRRFGSWGPAQLQGMAAARSVLGLDSAYTNPVPVCLIKVVRPEIISIGDIRKPQEFLEQNRHDFLISLFFQQRRLSGAILINASDYAVTVNRAIADNRDLSALLYWHLTARELLDTLSQEV